MEQVCKTTASDEDTLDHGAFIDAQGNEVQITEQMIQQACESLAKQLPNHHAIAAERSNS
ncbi:MAG: PA1571 family protein [Pseudomonadales bacterium]